MKRILVCYRINEYSTKMAGVFQKMLGQLGGFASQKNIEVYAMFMSRNRFTISRFEDNQLKPFIEISPVEIAGERERFWRLGIEHVHDVQPDIVYCRYDNQYDTSAMTDFMSHCKHVVKSTNIVEFPTYPYEQEISDKSKLDGDLMRRPELLNTLDFVASTHNSSMLLGKQNAYFSNKIDVQKAQFPISAGVQFDGVELELLALANVSHWHGYDRLLQGIAQYVTRYDKHDVHLHIVGDGNELEHLRALVNDLSVERYVSFHGFVKFEELAPYFQRCHAGVDSLGLHRKGLTHSCSLKTRSYIVNGLPVITAAIDDDVSGQPWVLQCSADETPVDIKSLKDELTTLYKTPNLSKKISEFAELNLSWSNHATLILEYSKRFQRQVDEAS